MLDTDIGRVETKRTSVRRTALMLYDFGRRLYAAPSMHTDYPLYLNGYLYAFSPDILCQRIFFRFTVGTCDTRRCSSLPSNGPENMA